MWLISDIIVSVEAALIYANIENSSIFLVKDYNSKSLRLVGGVFFPSLNKKQYLCNGTFEHQNDFCHFLKLHGNKR